MTYQEMITTLTEAQQKAVLLDEQQEHQQAAGVLRAAIDLVGSQPCPPDYKDDEGGGELAPQVQSMAREEERQLRRQMLLNGYLGM